MKNCFVHAPVLVPAWVAKTLARHGKPLGSLLDLAQAGLVLSQEDLSCLLELNTNPGIVLGNSHIRMGLLEYWPRCADAYERICNLQGLYPGQCTARLYAAGLQQDNVTPAQREVLDNGITNGCTPFEIRVSEAPHDGASITFVIVQPGYFGGPSTTYLQQACRRAVLKQSYASHDFEVVAGDPLFLPYFDAL